MVSSGYSISNISILLSPVGFWSNCQPMPVQLHSWVSLWAIFAGSNFDDDSAGSHKATIFVILLSRDDGKFLLPSSSDKNWEMLWNPLGLTKPWYKLSKAVAWRVGMNHGRGGDRMGSPQEIRCPQSTVDPRPTVFGMAHREVAPPEFFGQTAGGRKVG